MRRVHVGFTTWTRRNGRQQQQHLSRLPICLSSPLAAFFIINRSAVIRDDDNVGGRGGVQKQEHQISLTPRSSSSDAPGFKLFAESTKLNSHHPIYHDKVNEMLSRRIVRNSHHPKANYQIPSKRHHLKNPRSTEYLLTFPIRQ
jgi:hypothetical protein